MVLAQMPQRPPNPRRGEEQTQVPVLSVQSLQGHSSDLAFLVPRKGTF